MQLDENFVRAGLNERQAHKLEVIERLPFRESVGRVFLRRHFWRKEKGGIRQSLSNLDDAAFRPRWKRYSTRNIAPRFRADPLSRVQSPRFLGELVALESRSGRLHSNTVDSVQPSK